MTVTRLRRLFILALVPLLACNGGTEPPGPPAQLAKVSGDGQQWYFNNELPLAYTVQVTDANGREVPGVQVTWSIVLGTGSLSANPTNTDASGIASTVHTLSAASVYVVTATVSGLPPVTFSTSASAPPISDSVTVKDNLYDKSTVVVKVNGSVTWGWAGANNHSVTFGTGNPTSPTQSTGTYTLPFSTTGTFDYHCLVHGSGMSGKVIVVN
jgi:plastocyanin